MNVVVVAGISVVPDDTDTIAVVVVIYIIIVVVVCVVGCCYCLGRHCC